MSTTRRPAGRDRGMPGQAPPDRHARGRASRRGTIADRAAPRGGRPRVARSAFLLLLLALGLGACASAELEGWPLHPGARPAPTATAAPDDAEDGAGDGAGGPSLVTRAFLPVPAGGTPREVEATLARAEREAMAWYVDALEARGWQAQSDPAEPIVLLRDDAGCAGYVSTLAQVEPETGVLIELARREDDAACAAPPPR